MKMQIDINSCRVCLENLGEIPFFQNHGDEIASKMISSLFNIDVIYDDSLPTYICTNCLENIKLCILTKNIIVNSESMLSNYLKCNIIIGESLENLNDIKVKDEDPAVKPELIRLEAEELKIERFEDRSQDFEDEPCTSLQIGQVQSLTSFARNSEKGVIQEEIHSGTDDQEPKHDPAQQDISSTHLGENTFECLFCDKAFPSSCSLRAHKEIHFNLSGTKKVVKEKIPQINKCNSCKHIFATPYSLKLHMIIHTGVKEEECPHCGKKFALKGYLKRHIKFVHGAKK